MRRFALLVIIAVSAVLLPSTAYAQGADPDGDVLADQPRALHAAITDAERLIYLPDGETLAGSPTILLDASKGSIFDADPARDYASLFQLLNDQGYSVVVTPTGILDEDLSDYAVFMAFAVFAASPYTPSELEALDHYMAHGGSVFIAGDNSRCCRDAHEILNAVTQRLGNIRVGANALRPVSYHYSNLQAHPIMTGLSELFYQFGGALDVSGSATAIAFSDNGTHTLVAVNDGIVVVGDTSFLSDRLDGSLWDRADNTQFITNIFSYLIDDGVEPELSCAGFTVTISGAGDIVGTAGNDVIMGSNGADTIDGGGGADVICAGDGDDIVKGGAGGDIIYGGAGNDRVNGQGDADRVFGGPGDDVLLGNADNDMLGGGPGDDRLIGGPGADSLGGGEGDDFCRGSAGADRYFQCETGVV